MNLQPLEFCLLSPVFCLLYRNPELDKRVEILYSSRECSTNPPFFMQNKPNFRPSRPENDDFTKKQTQFKANTNPNKANFGPKTRGAKPIQTQF